MGSSRSRPAYQAAPHHRRPRVPPLEVAVGSHHLHALCRQIRPPRLLLAADPSWIRWSTAHLLSGPCSTREEGKTRRHHPR
jgi:hypothetical protein